MKDSLSIGGYVYADGATTDAHSFLLPALMMQLDKLKRSLAHDNLRVFDLGCGNGSVGAHIAKEGWSVTGIDPSSAGINQANEVYPHLNLELGSAYDDLPAKYGQFPVVISLEVVEHVYAPRDYARSLFDLVANGGTAIISTPYHSYIKNVALALSGKMDAHFTALWDHGHIKFWSRETLTQLLMEPGFENVRFLRVGRVPVVAKSMIAITQKPAGD